MGKEMGVPMTDNWLDVDRQTDRQSFVPMMDNWLGME